MFRRPTPENFANYQRQAGIGRQPKSGKIPIKRRKRTKLKKTLAGARPLQLRAQDIDKRRAVYRPDRLLQLHQSSLNNATRTAQEVQRGLTATGTTLGNERQLLEAKESSLIESRAKTELFKQLGSALKQNKPILGYSNHRAPDDLNSTSQRRAQGYKQESDSETRDKIYKAILGVGSRERPPSELGYREQRQPPDPVPEELGYRSQRQPEDLNRLESKSKFIPVEEPLLRTISQATESSEGIADIQELTPTPRPPPPPTSEPPKNQFVRPRGVSKGGLGKVQSLQRQGTAPQRAERPPLEPEPEPEPEPSPFEPPPRERGSTSQQAGPQLRKISAFPLELGGPPETPPIPPPLSVSKEDPNTSFFRQLGESEFDLQGRIGDAVKDQREEIETDVTLRGKFPKEATKYFREKSTGRSVASINWNNLNARNQETISRSMYEEIVNDGENDDFDKLLERTALFGGWELTDPSDYTTELFNVDSALGQDGFDSDIDDDDAKDRGFDTKEDALESLEEARDILQQYEDGDYYIGDEHKQRALSDLLKDGVIKINERTKEDRYAGPLRSVQLELDEQRWKDEYHRQPFAITGYAGSSWEPEESYQLYRSDTEEDSEEEDESEPSRQSSVASSVEPEPELDSSSSDDGEFRTITLGGKEYQLNVGENSLISEEEFEPIDGNFSLVNGKLFKTDNNGSRMVTSIFGDTAFVNQAPVKTFVPKSQRVPKGSHRMPDGSIMKDSAMEPEPEPERLAGGQVEDVTDEIADSFLTEVEGAFSGGKLFKKTGNKKKDYALDPDQNHYLIEMDGKKYVVVEHNPRTGNILLQIADTVNRGNADGKNRKNVKKDKLLKLIQDGDTPLQKISSNYKG